MAQIILVNGAVPLQRKITTFGSEFTHDIKILAKQTAISFTIVKEDFYFLLPGNVKLKVNGSSVNKKQELRHCDRLEWEGQVAVFLDSSLPTEITQAGRDSMAALKILEELAYNLQRDGAAAVDRTFHAIVDLAGADEGFLLSEVNRELEWDLVASRSSAVEGKSRKNFLSNTILREALEKRAPVYAESIIGHPWAEAASVIAARVFSVACFPLIVKEEVIGAVFLYTRTPGKAIEQKRLAEIHLLTTQVALLLALASRTRKLPEANLGLLFENSSPMREVQEKVRKLASTPMNILILGETGTGKELVARGLHKESVRKDAPFVALNCAAIPSTLLESTLFGYEKGAFTGAVRSQDGKFLLADGGTLFLDEIADMPLEIQAKLLRVLQDQMVERLGSNKPVRVNVRIVAATHQNLEQLVAQKKFRQDLYYRLNGAKIQIPPLRQRVMDISLLAETFLRRHAPAKKIDAKCLEWMEKYPWPGNVRELEQVVSRAAYLSDGDILEAKHLDLDLTPAFVDDKEQFWDSSSLSEAQATFTKSLVEKTLQKYQGNRQETAARLGISERTLYRILSESSV